MAARTWRAQVLNPIRPTPVPRPGRGNCLDVIRDALAGLCAAGESPVLKEAEDATSSQVGIHRVPQDHRHTHRWRGDQEGNRGIASLNDIGGTNQQLAPVMIEDLASDAELDASTEVVHMQSVNAAVHKAEAVGRADDRIATGVQYRTAVDRDAREVATKALPRVCERWLNRAENKL